MRTNAATRQSVVGLFISDSHSAAPVTQLGQRRLTNLIVAKPKVASFRMSIQPPAAKFRKIYGVPKTYACDHLLHERLDARPATHR